MARAYAVDDAGGVIVVDVENASPEAIGVAFRRATGVGGRRCSLTSRRAVGATEPDGAVVLPVPHRTSVRVAVAATGAGRRACTARCRDRRPRVGPRARAGMRTELPEPLQHDVDARACRPLARAAAAPPRSRARRLGLRRRSGRDVGSARHRAPGARRRRVTRRRCAGGDAACAGPRARGVITDRVRARVSARVARAVDRGPRRATATGTLSFAVRWHGARPALLWDVPAGSRCARPALDRGVVVDRPGRRDVARRTARALLPMGKRAPVGGAPVDAARGSSRERRTPSDLVAAGLYDPAAPSVRPRCSSCSSTCSTRWARRFPSSCKPQEQGGLMSFAAFRDLRTG